MMIERNNIDWKNYPLIHGFSGQSQVLPFLSLHKTYDQFDRLYSYERKSFTVHWFGIYVSKFFIDICDLISCFEIFESKVLKRQICFFNKGSLSYRHYIIYLASQAIKIWQFSFFFTYSNQFFKTISIVHVSNFFAK